MSYFTDVRRKTNSKISILNYTCFYSFFNVGPIFNSKDILLDSLWNLSQSLANN
jgi:hypothetical protein